jgi:hypothetical protein
MYLANRYEKPCSASGIGNESHCALRRGMDKLWIEHVLWTRQFIVSSVANLGDAGDAAQRLLKNQDEIGNAIAPFYGKNAGNALAKLLREHILIAADIVKAALAKDNEKVKTLDVKWHKNADDIAQFLNKANPNNWPEKALRDMFYEHLKVTTQELMLRIEKKWADDVTNYDKVVDQAVMMAKDLADGIVKQFPDKFDCAAINETYCKLRREMDRLWIDHFVWSRFFFVSEIAKLADTPFALERLLKNQDNIGASMVPYYGEQAGKDLAQLLREHILLAHEVYKALQTNDDATITEANKKWYQNSTDTAQFLHQLNPKHWDKGYLVNALYDHLEGATQKLMLRINGDWAGDIANADKSFAGAQAMGKYIADGIAKQFPEKFEG